MVALYRPRLFLCVLLGFPALAHSLSSYVDTRYGVTLRYPVGWAVTPILPSYLADPVVSPDHPEVAAISLSDGYRGTEFSGAELIYSVRPGLPAGACAELAPDIAESRETRKVAGVAFSHIVVDDAAMMKGRHDDLYTVVRGGNCYIFDLVLLTAAYGSADGMRRLSISDRAAIERQLQEILATVRIQPKRRDRHGNH